MKELVRCRPCGYVMEAGKLGDVCPACGLPRKVFEPYREKVSLNRLLLLNFDLHPIAIHLSQALVILIPVLAVITSFFSSFQPEILKSVLKFSVFMFPFTLVISIFTGIIDGLTMIVFALSKNFYLSAFVLFLSGAFDDVSVVIRSSILQIFTSDEMKGRVAAVNSIFIGSSNELGAFESGVAARLMGLVPSVIFGGAMTLIIVTFAAIKSPALRNLKLKS